MATKQEIKKALENWQGNLKYWEKDLEHTKEVIAGLKKSITFVQQSLKGTGPAAYGTRSDQKKSVYWMKKNLEEWNKILKNKKDMVARAKEKVRFYKSELKKA